ncbi:MAG TPA: hypothetical protein VGH29_18585 [Candidatus Binataceae bacterium]
MVNRLIFVLTAAFMLSGCCEYLGICTSVRVHTSISPSYKVAGQDSGISPAAACSQTAPIATLARLDNSGEKVSR